jgi:diacylglycerol kinase (ATP)
MKILKSFQHAVNGIMLCFSSQINFRVHVAATIAAAVAGSIFKLSIAEWLAILLCIAAVTVTEMINTAIEKICNLIDENYNKKVKHIKDIAAGAVLLSAVASLICGTLIFIPKILQIIK